MVWRHLAKVKIAVSIIASRSMIVLESLSPHLGDVSYEASDGCFIQRTPNKGL